jgi:mRNA interferase RelE/StbE
MTYDLAFLDEALKEWRKLDAVTREQFKARLAERLQNPKVPSARLHGAKERYKIKLRNAGFRLVYQVKDWELLVLVVAVGRRERNDVPMGAERGLVPTGADAARPFIAMRNVEKGCRLMRERVSAGNQLPECSSGATSSDSF